MTFEQLVRSDAVVAPAPEARRGLLSLELRRPARPVVGLPPQVSLLPRELRDAERRKQLKRMAIGAVATVALVTGLGIGLANLEAAAAQARLTQETQRTQALSAQVLKFADVQRLQQRIALGDAAVRVGSSTAIDWQKQLTAILADMPDGYAVKTVTADGATPMVDYAQGTGPLDVPRAATVSLTVSAPSIDALPTWLHDLRALPAYGDVTPSVAAGDSGFDVLLTLHLTAEAFITPIPNGAAK